MRAQPNNDFDAARHLGDAGNTPPSEEEPSTTVLDCHMPHSRLVADAHLAATKKKQIKINLKKKKFFVKCKKVNNNFFFPQKT